MASSSASLAICPSTPCVVSVDRAGNLFIADWGNGRVLKISPAGSGDGSSTIAAGGGSNWPGDGGSATAARLIRPASVAVDGAGNLFIGDAGQIPQAGYLPSVRKVSPGGIITTLAGGGRTYPPAPAMPLSGATGMATDGAGADGKLATAPLPQPVLPVTVTIDGQRANVMYYGASPGQVAGLMQVTVLIPSGVRPGGYVPAVLQVGTALSQPGLTIAVSMN